ncbi:MAG: hypothetical protein HXY20_05860 [Acidobacteria bacterium]|nr:hypothetical protein [Acidobacteriota bacterium]
MRQATGKRMVNARDEAALMGLLLAAGVAGLSPRLFPTSSLFGQFNNERRTGATGPSIWTRVPGPFTAP